MEKELKRNGVNVAWSFVAVLLLLAPMAAATDVTAVEEAESAVDEPEWIVNLLVIDAQTGEVTEWTDNGVLFTDVRVTGVESAASGYNLRGPMGEELFLNQSSTFAGYVEFYNQLLMPGNYHVSQLTNSSQYVVQFDATAYAIRGVGDDLLTIPDPTAMSGSRGGNTGTSTGGTSSGGGGGGSCSGTAGYTTTKLGEKTLWTPLVVGHAPYMGSGTAGSGWTSGKGIYYSHGYGGSAYTSTKSTEYSVSIPQGDGGTTTAVFQLAKWGHYKNVYKDRCGFVYTTYQAKVLDWGPTGSSWVKTLTIFGSSKATDSDDQETISYSGYGSVNYKTRYRTKDHMVETSAGAGVTASVSSGTYSKFDTGLSFSQGSVTVETTLQATTGTTKAWTYTFPKGDDYCWHVDYLGDGSTGGWAFKYYGSNGC